MMIKGITDNQMNNSPQKTRSLQGTNDNQTNNSSEKAKNLFSANIFLRCLFVLALLLSVLLCMDACNISKKCRYLSWIMNLNFSAFNTMATLLITLGIFITTYIVHDFSKDKRYQEDSFKAMCFLLDVIRTSYSTIRHKNHEFFKECKRLQKSNKKFTLVDKEIQFLQSYPFKDYEKAINSYISNGLLPVALIEKYIQYKRAFEKYVVQYVQNDVKSIDTKNILRDCVKDSIIIVRKSNPNYSEEITKNYFDIEQMVSGTLALVTPMR